MSTTASGRGWALVRLGAFAVALCAFATALTWAVIDPAHRILAGGEVGYEAALGAAAAAVGWLVLAWFAGCLLLALLARLPGIAGRCAGRLARRVTPALVRRTLEVGLGATLVLAGTGQLACATAAAAPLGGTANGNDTTGRSEQPLPRPDRPATKPSQPKKDEPAAVVVRRGDTLWDIAARELPGRPGAAEIAAHWPRWYGANRTAIGPDPNLIHPGQRLRAPSR